MSRFRYPVDTDQFQGIREDGKLYVDKTDMMYDLASKYRYVFLARPRRFGKSLLCNTFKAYFKGQKELFEACPEFMVSSSNQRGLKVMELEKEWKIKTWLHIKSQLWTLTTRECLKYQEYVRGGPGKRRFRGAMISPVTCNKNKNRKIQSV